MQEKHLLRQLFHEIFNNLNVISAISYTNACVFEDFTSNTQQEDTFDDIIKAFLENKVEIKEEIIRFAENFHSIIHLLRNEFQIESDVKKELQGVKDLFTNLCKDVDLLYIININTEEGREQDIAKVHDKLLEVYKDVHATADSMSDLKSRLVELEKYPMDAH